MTGRTPDQILGQLGADLQTAFRNDRRRLMLPRLPRRGLLAIAVAAFALVPTAVATREALWAPDPPPLPPVSRATGAAGTPVYVGSGTQHGVPWRLSAISCARSVGLFLTVRGGGAGARCDVQAPAAASAGVQTYYDPATDRTWAFGLAPATARQVLVRSRAYGGGPARRDRTAALAVDTQAIEQGHLPTGLRVFVVALPGGREVLDTTVTG